MDDLKIHETDATPAAMAHIEERMGPDDCRSGEPIETTDYQLVFSVGVQHFDIGPRYDNRAEVEWFLHQFTTALDEFIKISRQ